LTWHKPWSRLFVVVLVVAVYMLALGPVLWLEQRGYLPRILQSPAKVVFSPLFWVGDRSEAFARAYRCYIDLWIGIPYGSADE